jgi:putative ABC transport system permease protein
MLHAFAATLRTLLHRPGYALIVVVTLALGIGAATTVFALVHGIVLSALPFPDAERLVLIRNRNPGGSWNTSVVDHQAISAQATAFESAASMRAGDVLVGSGASAQWIPARFVTARYFDVLGLRAARGRTFASGDDAVGAPPTVVLGHAYAQREYRGADPVGRTLMLNGTAHTVVGVMPEGVEAYPVMRGDLWPILQLAEPERRGPFFLGTIARLRAGTSIEAGAADLEAVSRRIFPIWQRGFNDATARLAPLPLHDVVLAGNDTFLWVAFGAVVVVLLIALVNTANLMLMRLAQRGRDLGVRAALGASRWRLARLVMGENLLLVAAGTLAGLVLTTALLAQYRALGPAVPRLAEVGLTGAVVAFAVALATIGAIVFAVLPVAVGAIGHATGAAQAARGASAGRDSQRVRDALVVLEFALALPLLVAAGLLVDSLMRLQRVDPGFDARNLLTASIRLPQAAYPDPPAQIAFWQRALPELRRLPGVTGVALSGVLPPNCGCYNNFDVVGRPAEQGQEPQAPWVAADAGFFDALGVPLLEGRRFDDARDVPNEASGALIVTRSFAERYFPGESAVGREIYEGGNRERKLSIVGVVEDVKYDGLDAPGVAVFGPVSEGWVGASMYLTLRTATDPLALAKPMQAALQRLEPGLVPTDVATMQALLADALGGQRHWAAVIAGFAISALVLAAVGVFGVLAYHVANRAREIGIRQALGADARSIVGMVLGRGLRFALVGVVAGGVLAAFATQSLDALLFQVDRADPFAWLGAAAVLLAVAVVACWLPARRAARIDPQAALRQE